MTPEQFAELIAPLQELFNKQTDRGVAATKEGISAVGGRFSASSQRQEGRQRNERAGELDALISNLFFQQQDQLLNALGAQQTFGMQNLQPFLDFAGLGILPENTTVSDSNTTAGIKLGTGILGALNPAGG